MHPPATAERLRPPVARTSARETPSASTPSARRPLTTRSGFAALTCPCGTLARVIAEASSHRLCASLRERAELDFLITLRRYFLDDADEFWRAAVVDEVAHRALFVAGDVGVVAGEPPLGFAHQHDLVHLDHMRGPVLLRLKRGVGAGMAAVPHVLQQVRAPVDAVLDAAREIRRSGRALRSGRHQEIGEAMDEHAEQGGWRMLPFFGKPLAADAAYIDQIIGAGDGIESGGIDDDVEFVVSLGGAQARFGHANERRLAEIDEMHIIAVVGFEILRLQRQALHAKAVIPGD